MVVDDVGETAPDDVKEVNLSDRRCKRGGKVYI